MEEEQRWVVEEEERRRRTEVETTRYVINDGDEKAKILRELEELREGRVKMEQDREEMVKRIKGLQGKSSTRRNQARDVWKKKYFDEKKRTPAHEEKTNKLRQELENLHRRIMSTMEGNSDGKTPRHGGDPSTAASNPKESNLKIQATKYQHELDELHRKVENIKMRLTAEMKLRTQAETELRALRAELTQKKINVTLTRSQQYQAIGIAPPLDSYPAAHAVTPRT
ncbi:hypothetical protein CAPTEDRAFT_149845 [Capitella teleta]|uniref:Spermatogenesis-associated protein 1 C-terminal domain-containing protein n=1 Tax=Capitella teleta TaxID=283909 RepID=R7TD47_CAPTE|nr:hypothetical protein CAPTEDRAFT_149845 [Capitella teleta]|eukprot:ELT88991.1 hypothetical protein CAPTEDRAFT_149845 [Capitella teleta]